MSSPDVCDNANPSAKILSGVIPSLAVLLLACASPTSVEEREPPLPPAMIEVALAPVTGNDGGARAQFLSMVGREDLAPTEGQAVCPPLQRDGANVDAVEEIARVASDRRIVIVNEAHEHPQHRVFISNLAVRLRRDGFTIYAAETFIPGASEVRPWPQLSDGVYSREPTFGALLRRMRALGYNFTDYEDYSEAPAGEDWREAIDRREAVQAANLQRILASNPDARLFIHVGHSHLLEAPDAQGNRWMARRLKDATGIDPLTIDQTRYDSTGEQFTLCDPVDSSSESVDFFVGVPIVTFERGRPNWRRRQVQRLIDVPASLLNPELNTIVEARLAEEPDESVPVDRLLLRPGETLPLLLATGRYRIESWTQEHGYSAPVEISVD
jgi:hypothetical protein